MRPLFLAIALTLLSPPPATAAVTCQELAAEFGAHTPEPAVPEAVVIGTISGIVDMYAGIACFVGSPRCSCIDEVYLDPDALQVINDAIAECIEEASERDLWPIIAQAVDEVCPVE